MDYGFSLLWAVHILSVVAFFSGVVLLLVLAIRTFTPAQLRNWAIGLLIAGTIACLITIALLGRPWMSGGYYGANHAQDMMMGSMNSPQVQGSMMEGMMEMMMDHDERSPNEDHDDMEEMMRGMMQ